MGYSSDSSYVEIVVTVYHEVMGELANERTNERTENANLRERLANERERTEIRDSHDLSVRSQRTNYKINRAGIREHATTARRERRERHAHSTAKHRIHLTTARRACRERTRDAKGTAELAALYRRAQRAGTRAKIKAEINGSAEMRALRIAAVRRVTLLAGIPVLLAFAAWSTAGVQSGVTRLLDLQPGTFAWSASWGVEPALIAIVSLIIIGRAVLDSSGGGVDGRATAVEYSALSVSIILNVVGGWPVHDGISLHGIATAIPHSIGPVGCATAAFLIGLFESYVTNADPWANAPRLAELGLAANVEAFTPEPLPTPANNAVHQQTTEQVTCSPATGTVHRGTIVERTKPALRRTAEVSPELIERLDTEIPEWRTNMPGARAIAEVLGYSSSSTGNKIRRQLLVLVDQEQEK